MTAEIIKDQNPIFGGDSGYKDDVPTLWMVFYNKYITGTISSPETTWRFGTKSEILEAIKDNKCVKYVAPVFYYTEMIHKEVTND